MFIFGNVFAIFWLARAFLNAHPHIAYQIRCALAKIGLGSRRKAKQALDDAADAADTAEAPPAAAAGRKSASRSVTANVTAAAAAAAHDGIELSPSIGPARTASAAAAAAAGSNSHRHHHHHHSQPIICTPSMEVHAGDAASPTAAAAAAGLALANGRSADGSCSSYSSDDEGAKLPVQLQWVNMCYSVKSAAGRKHIIQVGRVFLGAAEGGRLCHGAGFQYLNLQITCLFHLCSGWCRVLAAQPFLHPLCNLY